ncbi:MAG TPA: ABC transporter substrate binding protein [Candidatus Kryptonia bacterium]
MFLFKAKASGLVWGVVITLIAFGSPSALESNASPQQQLFLVKELAPNAKTVGVLLDVSYNPQADLETKIQRASGQLNIKVVVEEISQLNEVAEKFRDLRENYHIQALWIPQNERLIGSQISRDYLIKNCTLNGIPLFAPNTDWVSEGACVALTVDDGEVTLHVNQKTLNALNLKIPDKYIANTQFIASN